MINFIVNTQRKFCNYSYAEAQYLATHGPKRLMCSAALGLCIIAVPYIIFNLALVATFVPLAVHRFIRRLRGS